MVKKNMESMGYLVGGNKRVNLNILISSNLFKSLKININGNKIIQIPLGFNYVFKNNEEEIKIYKQKDENNAF